MANVTLNITDANGNAAGTVEAPVELFGIEQDVVRAHVPLVHQVVIAQLAAARQGTHAVKNRARISGGGKKPWKQKGTGRARQGSIRAPQFAGGAVVHGPVPRDYSQRTPKKMKAAALRYVLSDRFNAGRVHVVNFGLGETPSTKAAKAALSVVENRFTTVVVSRENITEWLSVRNLTYVHVLFVDQLNTYDVVTAEDVVFTQDAFDAFVAAKTAKEA
ncbi:50S ribosomal protein L4 [Alloscardovia macacae]|uniref:Large ribosomal subunit protein uL4 n=1 Tax=Alloscardovia macacae TaxID=1160091 RepID=A0A1Y2SVJ4_9BIFI|nr:50S ribosomal protein L4 [Alloscardovia macacae]OTA27287.1 50S ribosomal protein L4 [Alloscardovia macacae]OTA29297.1 50S ribosomal protein L4 [Alloscardovia macacae]OZG54152.1 50S ribosomal protein L4 [Alloscardovia macacae]